MAKKSGRPAARKRAKTTVAKKAAPKAAPVKVRTGPRKIRKAQYKSFHLSKRIKHPVRLPNVFRLTRIAGLVLWQNKKLFLGITLLYGLLNLILVQGLASNTDVSTLKSTLDQIFTGHFAGLWSGLTIFAVLVSSAGNGSSGTAGGYQLVLGLVASLAVIWALRQVLTRNKNKVRIRDAYYRGMYPLVPFVLVLLVIALQILPLIIGMTLYGQVVSGGIAVFFIEKLFWALLAVMLGLLSAYMMVSSVFGLYIVTLPDMTPMRALRSARELVRYRRWTILRKILWLPVALLLAAAVVMVPIIVWATPVAQWVFFLLTMFAVAAVHAYLYSLYRELLVEKK
jgi:hypothetical protein